MLPNIGKVFTTPSISNKKNPKEKLEGTSMII
jgi:hypothetical protein